MRFEFLTDEEIIEESKIKKKSYIEDMLMKKIYRNYGEIATVQQVASYFKVSKSNIYKAIEERKIVAVKVGNKLLVVTSTLVNLLSGNEKFD